MTSSKIKLQILLAELRIKNTQCDVRLLIEYSARIANSLLLKNYRYEIAKFSFLQISLQDFAIDSIVPLFIRDKSGELPLRKALLNWDKNIIDGTSAGFFFYSR